MLNWQIERPEWESRRCKGLGTEIKAKPCSVQEQEHSQWRLFFSLVLEETVIAAILRKGTDRYLLCCVKTGKDVWS